MFKRFDIITEIKMSNVNYKSGNFNCSNCDLTTLEGCPEIVDGDFNCSFNKITSFKGCPKEVKGNFWCSGNHDLKDISDLPSAITKVCLYDCPNVTVFPKHIEKTLTLTNISESVLKSLKQNPYLEIIDENVDYPVGCFMATIREKTLGNQLLEAL